MSFRNFVRTKTLWNTSERLLLYTPYTCRVLIELIQRKLDFFTVMNIRFQGLVSQAATGGVLLKKLLFP